MIRTAEGRIRRRWKVAAVLLGVPLAVLLLFLIAAWIGSSIPRNDNWTQPDASEPGTVEILIETNGIHTGIVVPIVTAHKDWRGTFPSAARPRSDRRMPTHIAIGWGEKDVLLNTPTWADLSPATAARIVFGGGDGLLRVAHYVRPAPSSHHRRLRVRGEEYLRLAAQIEATLPPIQEGNQRATYQSYEAHAVHFDATGRYTITNTCNQWVSDTLAAAGIKTGSWTPFAGGVMKWVPLAEEQ